MGEPITYTIERRIVMNHDAPDPCDYFRTTRPKRKRGRRDNASEIAKYNRWKRMQDHFERAARRAAYLAFGIDPDAKPKNDTLTLADIEKWTRPATQESR